MSNQNIKTFKAGTQIITEGQPAACAYIVMKGQVRVFLDKDNKQVTLATLGIGSLLGESALFGKNEVYGAHAEAAGDVELVVISPAEFQEKLETCDPMIRNMFDILTARLRKTNAALLDSETREFMDLVLI